ncbi:MAG TPA: hypothetical protein VGY58_11345 [Gemmataceae bacterium]|nr:hypothetical protein [Gemmataceae bacterium]
MQRMATCQGIFQSRAAFCLGVALAMVLARVVIFDARFFHGERLPNHDMSEALPFFATNMHSMRQSGEIAWWNPVSNNGYAQYYQSFLSPLAPTPHHVVFIAWAQFIRVVSLLGGSIPEYYQYLTVTYLILPFLTFLGFSLFASFLFRQRLTALLVTMVYTFSGIGLWNSAWFYFQESCTLFVLLAASIAALQRPSPRRLWLLFAALLVQVTSINYWTVYNFFFIAILLGSYCWAYANQVRRLYCRVAALLRQRTPANVGVLVLAGGLLAVWAVMIYSVLAEQRNTFVRPIIDRNLSTFSTEDAYAMRQDIRSYTSELFNPILGEVTSGPNPMHGAHYLGCALLPLLLLAGLRCWQRRERWLLAAAAGTFVVCLAPPFLLTLWRVLPMMGQVRHLFRFYPHHWQLMVLLFAGTGLDVLLEGRLPEVARTRFVLISKWLAAILGVLLLAGVSIPALPCNLYFVIFTLAAVGVVARLVVVPNVKTGRLCTALLLLLTFGDLTRYFWDVSLADARFTQKHLGIAVPLAEELRAALAKSWAEPSLNEGFEAGVLNNFPTVDYFWPRNGYLVAQHYVEAKTAEQLCAAGAFLAGEPLEFYHKAVAIDDPQQTPAVLAQHREAICKKQELLLHSSGEGPGARGEKQPLVFSGPSPLVPRPSNGRMTYAMRKWTYNGTDFEVLAPDDGWLFVRQLYDPRWTIHMDDASVRPVRANFAGMAVPLPRGRHLLKLEYHPLARGMYWWACLLFEGTLLSCVVQAIRHKRAALPIAEAPPELVILPFERRAA